MSQSVLFSCWGYVTQKRSGGANSGATISNYHWGARRPTRTSPMPIGTCSACQIPKIRLATSTTDCPCLVCESCGNRFLAQAVCGVCGTTFTEDELWTEDLDTA